MKQMNVIALTSANEHSMAAVAEQLLALSTARNVPLAVMVGIKTAHDAMAVFSGKGELWRVGEDSTHPELDPLIDCQISDSAPQLMSRFVDQNATRFLGLDAAPPCSTSPCCGVCAS